MALPVLISIFKTVNETGPAPSGRTLTLHLPQVGAGPLGQAAVRVPRDEEFERFGRAAASRHIVFLFHRYVGVPRRRHGAFRRSWGGRLAGTGFLGHQNVLPGRNKVRDREQRHGSRQHREYQAETADFRDFSHFFTVARFGRRLYAVKPD